MGLQVMGTLLAVQEELVQAVRMIGIFGASSNGNELCRRLANDALFGVGTEGIQLYALTSTGRWERLGSFGKLGYPDGKLTQFDDCLMTEAARTREVVVGKLTVDDKELDAVACVLLRDDMPVGVMLRISTPGSFIFNPTNGTLRAIQDSGGLFLDSIGYKTVSSSEGAKEASPSDMTERQLAILVEMAHGKTNLVIANEMILSESTVKQESVKIFRALGVGTRQQAVLKANTLGLLPDGIEIKV